MLERDHGYSVNVVDSTYFCQKSKTAGIAVFDRIF